MNYNNQKEIRKQTKHENNLTSTELVKEYCVNPSTISTKLSTKTKILRLYDKNLVDVDQAVICWFN
ncbi:hypothetical protein BpHYR1_041704 [Brachionus plicatilis]|uniref:HTH psq-type domain-containing protein n=1 Tax=Brachionus plicatilis TaxID=10195 RepID=A0A3M7Q875_BRAPC|nr:hypothetical protein BpHYR1_041704 [Brachionus plicatilis]